MEGDGRVAPVSPLVDFVAGTVGGIASLLAGHPFDTIKTRLQAQSQAPIYSTLPHNALAAPVASTSTTPLTTSIPSIAGGQARYTSSIDALRRIVAEERFLGLYKGVTSPMLGVAVMNASVFGVYGLALHRLQGEEQTIGLYNIFLAGCASGVISAFITSPIDLIKIRQQMSFEVSSKEPSTLRVVQDIWKRGGLRGMYLGLGSTCIRDLGYGPYFLSYEVINRLLLSRKGDSNASLSNLDLAFSGGIAGVIAWMSTFGADVVKTRVQASDRTQSGARSTFLTSARDTYREGGWRAFFAGAGPTILRALPVNAVLFITFEATKDLLTRQGSS